MGRGGRDGAECVRLNATRCEDGVGAGVGGVRRLSRTLLAVVGHFGGSVDHVRFYQLVREKGKGVRGVRPCCDLFLPFTTVPYLTFFCINPFRLASLRQLVRPL